MEIIRTLTRHLTHNGDDCCDGDHSNIASTLISIRQQQQQQQSGTTKHTHSHSPSSKPSSKIGTKAKGSFLDLMKHFLSVVSSSFRGKVLLTIWGSFLLGVYFIQTTKQKKKTKTSNEKNEKKKKKILKKMNSSSPGSSTHAHDHNQTQNQDEEENKVQQSPPLTLSNVVSFITRTIQPHLTTSYFGLKLLLYLGLLTYRIRVTVKIATITGRLGSYFGSRRWTKMFEGQVTFGLWCMVASGTTAAMKYMEKIVAVRTTSSLACVNFLNCFFFCHPR